jgi:acyl-homoserine-lactone acylase
MDGTRRSCLPDSSPDAAAPGIFPHSEIPTLIRRDYVENGNDSHWLTNPHEPLTGYDRVIGIENAERTYRTRIGLIQAEERIAGTDGLSGKGFNLKRLEQVSMGNRHYLGELWRDDLVGLCNTLPVMVGESGPVNVAEACDALEAWDLRDNLDSRGAILFWRFAANLLSNFRAVPTGTQGGILVGSQSVFTTQYSNADPVNTPSGLNILNPLVQAALADAVGDLEGIGAAMDDPLGKWQYDVRGGKRIPIHGGPGGQGVFNVITGVWDPAEGYSDIRHGSSFVAAVQFTGGKCPVKADTFVTYSQSQDETSRHVNDFTKAYSRKDWARAAVCPAQVRRSAVKTVRVRSGK